uniref:Uncharacterized protein n=1 Tax=Rousettus aegyptiacus TaxID=9407 RepID=A0A7J8FJK1_ROUAE|nr:hypothetical protein HJG63_012170 [Rousettus aegyptiacus]
MLRSPLQVLFSFMVSVRGGEGSQAKRRGEDYSLPVFVSRASDPFHLAFLAGTPVPPRGGMCLPGLFSIVKLGVGKHIVLIFNSLMMYDVEHLLICFYDIWIHSLVRCLFRFWLIFNLGCLFSYC